ncbi:MAG: HNH endonuclease, partial [Candidatus Krumholzibacteriota bacterium]|nr:HNH endonuclease [Candidatus Krumholzibacteriota bacterium]
MKRNNKKVVISSSKLSRLYNKGKTIADIAQQFGVSVQPIRRILKEANVKMRIAARQKGSISGEKNPRWKGGRRTRKDGYVLIWTPTGDKLEHRVVMEQHIGRHLLPAEIVHHKDNNPSNNAIENLEIYASQSEHALHHATENRKILLSKGVKQCTKCLVVKLL